MSFFRSVVKLSQLRSRSRLAQQSAPLGSVRWLQTFTASDLDLRSQVEQMIPEQRDRIKKLKSEHGNVQIGNITVNMVIGGMREMTALLWEGSKVDSNEGIRFRGLSIPECQQVLPAATPGGEPMAEGILWLLLTGKMQPRVALAGEVIPLKDEKAKVITEDLRESVLLEEKAINEASYTVSALLSSARISCRLRSEKFQEMLNQSSNYVVYKLNVEL